jgi:hypothetical protein
MIPRNVRFIDGSAFCNVTISSLLIESGNETFIIKQNFLIDNVRHILIHNFSTSSHLEIPYDIEILGSSCFSTCESFSSISFESNSRLTRIESEAFSNSGLQSIVIPRSVRFIDGSAFCGVESSFCLHQTESEQFVFQNSFLIDVVHHTLIRNFSTSSNPEIPYDIEILGSSCFAGYESFSSFSSISFESNSRLKRINSSAIPLDVLVIAIPSRILFIAYDAVPNVVRLTLSDAHSCPEFEKWQQLRQSGILVDFRRIVRLNSGLPDFKYYLLDLSLFEEQSVSSQIYQRLSDETLIVVKSIDLSKSIGKTQIENELENLLNLSHPLLITPLSFVISRGKLNIGRLYTEVCSLMEVLSTEPTWWTPTAKAKAVVGIALGIRFLHGFGLLHGRLNSRNILFDEEHRIQIADFSTIRLESGVIGGFSGEDWTPRVDVSGFAVLLFEITAGSQMPQTAVENGEITLPSGVPVFVSEIIKEGLCPESNKKRSFVDIFEILKENDFRIMGGVDVEEVSDFVKWVESVE